LKTCVIQKSIDLASCTTKVNSAIVHSGFDSNPNSLKAKLNV